MASAYLLEQLQQQKQLLRSLILKELPLEEEDPNFAIAWDFCTSNLNPKYHNHKDTDSHDVARCYDALCTRLEQNGQLSKAASLHQLVAQLKGCEPAGAQQEPSEAILSLLFNLANKPLESAPLAWPSDSKTRACCNVGNAGDSSSGASADSHDDAYTTRNIPSSEEHSDDLQDDSDETSELSDWDADDHAATTDCNTTNTEAPSTQPQQHNSKHTVACATSTGALQAHAGLQQDVVRDVPVSLLRPADSLIAVATSAPQDLVPCLTRCRLARTLMQPQSAQCLTDQYLVHQVCNLLTTGESACFKWQAASLASRGISGTSPSAHWNLSSLSSVQQYGAYHAISGLHTPHLSEGMLADILSKFAACGSQLAWMRALIHAAERQASMPATVAHSVSHTDTATSATVTATGVARLQAGPVLTATCCALLQGVRAQIHQMMQPVISIQQSNRFPPPEHLEGSSCNGSAHPAASTSGGCTCVGVGMQVLQLQVLLAGFVRHTQSLHDMLSAALHSYMQALDQHHIPGVPSDTAPGTASVSTQPTNTPSRSMSSSGRASTAGTSPQQTSDEQLALAAARAHASSAVIDVLCDQLQLAPVQSGPHGLAAQQRLLHLLCCALGPLLNSLQSWLHEGTESGSTSLADDFFIAAKLRVNETDPLFWSHGYAVLVKPSRQAPAVQGLSSAGTDAGSVGGAPRPAGAAGPPAAGAASSGDLVACPLFLQPLARHILSAGKAVRLLQAAGQTSTTPGMSSLLATVPGLLLVPKPMQTAKKTAGPTAAGRFPVQRSVGDSQRMQHSLAAARGLSLPAPALVDLQLQFLQQLHEQLAECLVDPGNGRVILPRGIAQTPRKASVTALYSQPTSPNRQVSPGSHMSAASEMSEGTTPVMSHFERMAGAGVAMSSLQPWKEGQQPSSAWTAPWTRQQVYDDTSSNDDSEPDDDLQATECAARLVACQGQMEQQQKPTQAAPAKDPSSCPIHVGVVVDGKPAGSATATATATETTMSVNASDSAVVEAAADAGAGGPLPLTEWMHGVTNGLYADAPALGWNALPRTHAGQSLGVQAPQPHNPGMTSPLPRPQSPHTLLTQAREAHGHRGTQRSMYYAGTCLLPAQHPHRLLAWLLSRPSVDMPPLSQLLEDCLLQPLHIRVCDVEQQLLGCLMSSWGFMAELKSLRNLYLMSAPAAQAWATRLLASVLEGRPLEQHSAYELETALQEACSEAVDEQEEALPAADCLSVVLDTARVHELRAAGMSSQAAVQITSGNTARDAPARVLPLGGLHSVMELEALQVAYTPSWHMSILGPTQVLTSYNKVFTFLLQINAARMALDRVRLASLKFWQAQARIVSLVTTHACQQSVAQNRSAGSNLPSGAVGNRPTGLSSYLFQQRQQQQWELLTGLSASKGSATGLLGQAGRKAAPVASQFAEVALTRHDEVVLQEMVHFVSNLHTYVVDKLLYGAWQQLQQELDKVSSLDDMVHAHQAFMCELEVQSGKAGTGAPAANTWRHLVHAILRLLDQVLRQCAGLHVLMEQLGLMNQQIASTIPQGGHGSVDKTTQLKRPPSQEVICLARQQVTSSQQNMQHLRNYLVNFISSTSARRGSCGDTTELLNLVMRIQFNQRTGGGSSGTWS